MIIKPELKKYLLIDFTLFSLISMIPIHCLIPKILLTLTKNKIIKTALYGISLVLNMFYCSSLMFNA